MSSQITEFIFGPIREEDKAEIMSEKYPAWFREALLDGEVRIGLAGNKGYLSIYAEDPCVRYLSCKVVKTPTGVALIEVEINVDDEFM